MKKNFIFLTFVLFILSVGFSSDMAIAAPVVPEYKIDKNVSSLPAEYVEIIERWDGRWQKDVEFVLVVERVDVGMATAEVLLVIERGSLGKSGQFRLNARIIRNKNGDIGLEMTHSPESGSLLTFFLKKDEKGKYLDGTWKMRHYQAGWIETYSIMRPFR